MHIAIGYNWFVTSAGYHLERALRDLGHKVTYVGLPSSRRPGYDSAVRVDQLFATWPRPPDLYLWVDPAGRYFPPGIEDLTIPTACYLIDVHLGNWRPAVGQCFDAVFIAQKDYLPEYRLAVGHGQVYWLPLAAAPDVHRAHDLPQAYDVAFVGNIAAAHRRTPRERRLRMLAERYDTNDFFRFYPPEELGKVYGQARIVFNSSIAGDVTMRVFEGTACGALLLTDSVGNGLDNLFDLGDEIVTYGDDAELVDRIDYYLAHEDERARIAQAGQRRTLREHTYMHRMQVVLDLVSSTSFRRLAPLRSAGAEQRRRTRLIVYSRLHMLDVALDELKAGGYGPLRRAWSVWPGLVRRLVR